MGIIFTETQQKLIKSLEETGQVAKAQEIILQALEERFSGAAAAARNTLGGAIDGLKNALGDLFESTDQGANKAAEGINEITTAVSSPQFKSAVQSFVGELSEWLAALANLIGKAVEGWRLLNELAWDAQRAISPDTAFENLLDRQEAIADKLARAIEARDKVRRTGSTGTGSIVSLRDLDRDVEALRGELEDVQRQLQSRRQAPGTGRVGEDWIRGGAIGGRDSRNITSGGNFVSDAEFQQSLEDSAAAARAPIDEVRITAQKKNIEGLNKLLQEFDEQTRTSLESANSQFETTQLKLLELYQAGVIGVEQIVDRLSAATIQFNESIDIEPMKVSVQKVAETLSKQQRAVQGFVETIKTGLTNLAMSGEITGKSILKYLLSALTSKALMKAIDALGAALSKALSKSGSKGGAAGFVAGLIGAFSAGGGRTSGPRIVGEEGPELLMDGGNVMNKRQLAFAMGGGGGGVVINNSNVFNVDGSASPEQTAAYIETRIAQNNKKQAEQIGQLLYRNGLGAMR